MLLNELKSISVLSVNQSFSSDECNEYEFFNSDNRKICYIVEYFNSPIDNSKLDYTVYELYYDNENMTNNHEDDDFLASYVFDDKSELLSTFSELIESV